MSVSEHLLIRTDNSFMPMIASAPKPHSMIFGGNVLMFNNTRGAGISMSSDMERTPLTFAK